MTEFHIAPYSLWCRSRPDWWYFNGLRVYTSGLVSINREVKDKDRKCKIKNEKCRL